MANGKIRFQKPVVGHKNLLELLRRRGLRIDDETLAYWAMERIGYYRFTGYCLPFQNRRHPLAPNDFLAGTSMQDVLDLYEFDTSLRRLIGHALGLLEVALRTTICERMCSLYQAHWYIEPDSFEVGKFQGIYDEAAKHVNFDAKNNRPFFENADSANAHARHLFLDHYYQKYSPPQLPPAWMLRESASFGFWARLFDALKSADRKMITQAWVHLDGKKIDDVLLASWLWSLTILRNRCSHHARITNRDFPFQPQLPGKSPNKELFLSKTNDLRTLMSIILVLTKKAVPSFNWREEVLALFDAHPTVNIEKATGFTREGKASWSETTFWTHPSVNM